MTLAGGGAVVAAMLGGRRLEPGATDANERKLLNVVEEMAIASGVPVPPVYVMDQEAGINAFAAGFAPDNAVIGVTRGCMELLSRDELQGVVAHEFSHILNGDMRLNLRVIALLHGILLIALTGGLILRILGQARSGSSSSSGKGKGGGGIILVIIVLGVLLLIIGYIGTFFGNLIKSALSRQREFLADASAVQFTRNPGGLGGALKRIGGLMRGSRLENEHAPEASHLFFGQAVRARLFDSLFATHPSLDERIRRIDPTFDGTYPETRLPASERVALKDRYAGVPTPGAEPATDDDDDSILRSWASGGDAGAAMAVAPAAVVARIGAPQTQHLDYARVLRDSLPPVLVDLARETYGARTVIYGLLISRDAEVRRAQLARLEAKAEPVVVTDLKKALPEFEKLEPRQRLPLLDLAMPALQALSETQYRPFRENVKYLVEADARIEVFEYAIQTALWRRLDPKFSGSGDRPGVIRYYALAPVAGQCAILLSALANVGQDDAAAAAKAFAAGTIGLNLGGARLSYLPADVCTFKALDEALAELRAVAPQGKRQLIEACVACIAADGRIAVAEAELLRVVADSLGCPVPPLLPEA